MQSLRTRSRHLRLPISQRRLAYAVSVAPVVAGRCVEGIIAADAMPGGATIGNLIPTIVNRVVALTAVLPREIEIVPTPEPSSSAVQDTCKPLIINDLWILTVTVGAVNRYS